MTGTRAAGHTPAVHAPWGVALALAVALGVSPLGCSEFREGPLGDGGSATDATARTDVPRCDGGPCALDQGLACATGTDCASGQCVDGVCCNVACTGQCEACDGPVPGLCAAITGVPHGSRTVCPGTGVCTQTCNGTDRMACTLPAGSTCPRCGDGVCSTGETCSSCPGDCGPCAISCMACTTGADCPTGSHCARRSCDGTLGCLQNVGGPACMDIAGMMCPPVGAYQHCTRGSADCGPAATCTSDSLSRMPLCERQCARSADCPDPPVGFPQLTATCDTNTGLCFLECPTEGTCPYNLTCLPFSDGTFGYCD